MKFEILSRLQRSHYNSKSTVYLIWDNWNDYSFYTLFGLVYVDENSKIYEIGSVKIGYFGQKESERKLKINESFETLDDTFFSVGQSDEYYAELNDLGPAVRDFILIGLKDIARDSEIYKKAVKEAVTKISLFRDVSPTSVKGQFRRLAIGGVRLTNYNFKFTNPKIKEDSNTFELSFDVEPESFPPTNIHVLIGRNGVGKTHLINNMINALITNGRQTKTYGKFTTEIDNDETHLFANLISISFSAFDVSKPQPERKDKTLGIQYSYIGLKQVQIDDTIELGPKSTIMLNDEFYNSLYTCKRSAKTERWRKSIEMLESDPLFKEAEIMSLIDKDFDKEGRSKEHILKIFGKLSSGHKIILLTITRLIENLQERSLVLIDEPEAHLHPPLLSAFIRTLSELLTAANGVAIIATHSPVILQEVPKSCAWKLRRRGAEAIAERLEIESFGQNVGVLTNEVFRLEVTNSGFYELINKVAQEKENYEEVIEHFNDQLGMEARAIIMSILANKNR